MDDGARTHDRRNHNPELYQLSYAHHCKQGAYFTLFLVIRRPGRFDQDQTLCKPLDHESQDSNPRDLSDSILRGLSDSNHRGLSDSNPRDLSDSNPRDLSDSNPRDLSDSNRWSLRGA